MTHDPAIIKAAAQVLQNESYMFTDDEEDNRVVRAILTAVTPLIETATLERAAKVAENYPVLEARSIAAKIRALKEQP